MPGDLLKSLQQKISRIESDPLARPGCPHVRLSGDTLLEPATGALKGSIEVFISGENGEEKILCQESLDGIETEEEAVDCLARALSLALMDLQRWNSR